MRPDGQQIIHQIYHKPLRYNNSSLEQSFGKENVQLSYHNFFFNNYICVALLKDITFYKV